MMEPEKALFGPDDGRLRMLAEQLDSLQDAEAKEQALVAYLQQTVDDLETKGKPTQDSPAVPSPSGDSQAEPSTEGPDTNQINNGAFDLAMKHGLGDVFISWVMNRSLSASRDPLDRLPCAFTKIEENWTCENEGKMACGNCKLVSYCSKECQRGHWPLHKKHCKDEIRSPDWQPAWIRERRTPSFATNGTAWVVPEKERSFALGLHVWGNVPAFDSLNLANNEGIASMTTDKIALAYVASGDLRNVVRTVNELPHDFSGEMTILLNDREPMIVLRNILLLMILGSVENINHAADIALHFWNSVFVQPQHAPTHARVCLQLTEALKPGNFFSLYLGKKSVISGVISDSTKNLLRLMTQSEMRYEDAGEELMRVRLEPSRIDRHHRKYCRLKPSHRLAFSDYRRSGIVFPFGAPVPFSCANKFLFSPDGRWLADDLASPLNSWNVEDVVAAGKAHGAQSADIYGCLYFYLTDQLRAFAKRIQKFKISFKLFTQDARDLARNLVDGRYESQGLSKDISFDRIDVSNIIDSEYVGVSNVLADWAPFLNRNNSCSAIIGYSMNWVPKQLGSQPGEAAMKTITLKLIEMGKIGAHNAHPDLLGAWFKYYMALYENSAAFEEYLKRQGTDEAADRPGLKRKFRHTVVPHRVGGRIGDPIKALPYFPTEDSWYWNVQVSQSLLSERFVEFCRT